MTRGPAPSGRAATPPHTLATVSYCQYGFDYQKNTHIWTNDIEWAKKKAKKCSPSCPKMKNGKHEYGVHKHPHMKGAPKSLEERYQMPPALIEEILGTHHRLGDDVTVSTVGDAKDDAMNSRLEELDDKIERLTPTVSPVAGGADAVDELSLGMANASISRDDGVMTADQWANDAVMFPEFLKCHMCLKTTTDDDGVYFEETMWICYPCVYQIRDGEIGSPR